MLARVRARPRLLGSLLLWCGLGCSNAAPRAQPERSSRASAVEARAGASERNGNDGASARDDRAPGVPTAGEQADAGHDKAPGRGTSDAVGESAPVRAGAQLALRAPPHGCAIGAAQELGAGERGVALYLGAAPGVLVVAPDGRSLALWTAAGARFVPGPRVALESPLSRATALCAESCELALVDARGRLLSVALTSAGFSSPRTLANGLDRRFAPALARLGARLLYAYTGTVDEVMHTLLVERHGEQADAPRDLTPLGHGAGAPAFVLGASVPILVALDARGGVSPLLEWTFDQAGAPSEARVRTPVSQPYAPPLLAAVQRADGEVEVAYTAIGRVAMTAVGRVPLRRASEPSALLPSRGYGELAFSAARGRRIALFALESPSTSAANAPKSVVFKLLDGAQAYDGPELAAGDAGVRRPSLASGPSPGVFLLAYTRASAVYAAPVACDDP